MYEQREVTIRTYTLIKIDKRRSLYFMKKTLVFAFFYIASKNSRRIGNFYMSVDGCAAEKGRLEMGVKS